MMKIFNSFLIICISIVNKLTILLILNILNFLHYSIHCTCGFCSWSKNICYCDLIWNTHLHSLQRKNLADAVVTKTLYIILYMTQWRAVTFWIHTFLHNSSCCSCSQTLLNYFLAISLICAILFLHSGIKIIEASVFSTSFKYYAFSE
jgi:hypothetical protein